MASNSSRPFSLQGSSSRPPIELQWKALLLAGTLSGAFAQDYAVIRLAVGDVSATLDTIGIDDNLNTIIGSSSYFGKVEASQLLGYPAYSWDNQSYYIDGGHSGEGVVNLGSSDLLKALNAAEIMIAGPNYEGYSPYGGSAFSYTNISNSSVSSQTYMHPTNLRIDAAGNTGPYAIAVPMEIESAARIVILTSDNHETAPTTAEVSMGSAITGAGTFGQEGNQGSIILEVGAPEFSGTLLVDNYIDVKDFVKLNSLKNYNEDLASLKGMGRKLNMDLTIAATPVMRTGVEFYTSASGDWEVNISAEGASPYMDVHKSGEGFLNALSQSEFSGGVVIEAGTIKVQADSTLNGSGAMVSGPLGIGRTEVHSSGTLEIDGNTNGGADEVHTIHNDLLLKSGSSLASYYNGVVGNLSTITVDGLVAMESSDGDLYVHGQIIAGANYTGLNNILTISSGDVHFNNQKSGDLANTYGGFTKINPGAVLHVDTALSLGAPAVGVSASSLTSLDLWGKVDFKDIQPDSAVPNHIDMHSGGAIYFGSQGESTSKNMTLSGTISAIGASDSDISNVFVGQNKHLSMTGAVDLVATGQADHKIVKLGLGNLTLAGANTYSGLIVNQGSVTLGAGLSVDNGVHKSPLGNGHAVEVCADATLDLAGFSLFDEGITAEVGLYGNSSQARNATYGNPFGDLDAQGPMLKNSSSSGSSVASLKLYKYYGNLSSGTDSVVYRVAPAMGNITLSSLDYESVLVYHDNAPGPSVNRPVLKKLGSGDLILLEDCSFPSDLDLNITDGNVISWGSIGGNTVTIAAGSIFAVGTGSDFAEYEFAPLSVGSTITTAGPASTIEVLNGWRCFTGIPSGPGKLDIYAAGEGPQGTATIDATFAMTGEISVGGILECNILGDKSLPNAIGGDGLIKKDGAARLDLTVADLNFAGSLVVYDGELVIPLATAAALDPNLKVYAGSQYLSGFHQRTGQATPLTSGPFAGDFSGYYVDSMGDIHIGRNTKTLCRVTPGNSSYDGTSLTDGMELARMVASSAAPTPLESVNIISQDWALSGQFIRGSFASAGIAVGASGRLALEPGFNYVDGAVTVGATGSLSIHGFKNDRRVVIPSLTLQAGSDLSIQVNAVGSRANIMSLDLETLTAQDASIRLLLDPNENSSDRALIRVTDVISLTGSTTILVAPTGTVLENSRFNLLEISSALDPSVYTGIIARLAASPTFSIIEPSFVDGILSCSIGSESLYDIMIPYEYLSLGNGIVSQSNAVDAFTQLLHELIMTPRPEAELREILSAIQPILTNIANQTGLTSPQISFAQNIIHQANSGFSINKLMQNQGDYSSASAKFAKASFESSMKGRNLLSGKVARATDPGTQIRMQDYQNLNMSGLSFSSETSYSHQSMEASSTAPANTQHTWATSLAATYKPIDRLVYGAVLTTSKTNQNLSPNQEQKTGHRGDSYNTAGLLGVYQGEAQPWYVSGVLTYGQHNYDVNRTWIQPVLNAPSVACQAVADYKGYELYVTTEFGWRFQMSETLMFQPFIGYVNSHVSTTTYTETSTNVDDGAANDYGITAPAQSRTNQAYNTGVEVNQFGKMGDLKYMVSTRLGYTTQKDAGQTSTYTYSYLGAPNASYDVVQENKRYNTLDLSFGIHTQVKENLLVNAVYTGNFGSSANTNTLMASLEYQFG